MNVFSEKQKIFLKTVYKFCKEDYEHFYYQENNKNLSNFIQHIIIQAFEDREYELALYQMFHTKEQIVYILSFVCSKIWFNN